MDGTFSFLVTTDNHLGYKDNHNIRRKDSYNAFEEALYISREKDVDFILLGGDLFHTSRPSANIEHRCIKTIRKHINANANKKVLFKRISGTLSHSNKFTHANFEDPNLNIQHPIFTIHGNHDDPIGSQSQSICAKLATCGLINYFGDLDCKEFIRVEPIVFQKQNMKIALYGMGFIPDFRLKRYFDENKVKFVDPPKDSYNILVVHQNRVARDKAKYIPDEYFPKYFHLIIRGHEHSSQEPSKLVDSQVNGLVFQPGSTVATSISPMESGPKQVAIITIRMNNPRCDPKDMYHVSWELIKLQCCRPMILKDISQKEMYKRIKSLHGDSKITASVFKRYSREFIESKISEYLEEFNSQRTEISSPITNKKFAQIAASYVPILRLRLEYISKGEKFDPSEISDKLYPDQIVNKDIISFKKQKLLKRDDGEIENITFANDDEDEEDDEDFDFIDLSWEQKESIDIMIQDYFKDKPESERLKALSLTEYVTSVQKTDEDRNVISTVLNKKKCLIMGKFRQTLNDPKKVEHFMDKSEVEKFFIEQFSRENLLYEEMDY